MFKVLVVDDEKAIRDNIASAVPFEDYGFSVKGTAKNGKEALMKLGQATYDLIMLDVNMPVMNGLEFLEALSESRYSHIKVMMLSGYSDFNYAKKAIRYGVKAYLTKPIDEDEAVRVLDEIREELIASGRQRKQVTVNDGILNFKGLYNSGKGDLDCLKDYMLMYCVVMGQMADRQHLYSLDLINQALSEHFGNEAYGLIRSRGSLFTYLIPRKAVESRHGDSASFGNRLMWRFRDMGVDVAVLVDETSSFDDALSVRRLYTDNLYHMLTDLFYESAPMICVRKSHCTRPHRELMTKQSLLGKFKNNLMEMNFSHIEKDFNELCQELEVCRYGIEYIYEISFRMYYLALDVLNGLGDEAVEDGLQFPEWRDFHLFEGFSQWKSREKEQMNSLFDRISQLRGIGSQCCTYQAIISYIHSHSHDTVSIKDIAETLHLNPTYVGRLFKQTAGVSIKQYLNNMRIGEAKELLLNSNMMVYEIAEALGYGESKYFVSKFTDAVGTSPSQYRKTGKAKTYANI